MRPWQTDRLRPSGASRRSFSLDPTGEPCPWNYPVPFTEGRPTMANVTGKWKLDSENSEVGFEVRAAAITKIRGRFTDVAGTVVADGERADVNATVQVASFEAEAPEWNDFVTGPDLLDAETYPTVDFVGAYENDRITGDLTVHGVTQQVEFKVANFEEAPAAAEERLEAEAKTKISRSDFDLTWSAALEVGGLLVSDKVSLTLSLAFVKDE